MIITKREKSNKFITITLIANIAAWYRPYDLVEAKCLVDGNATQTVSIIKLCKVKKKVC